MPHYVILISYRKPFTEFESLLPTHREHLQRGVEAGIVLLSGPQNPRTGGVIIARAESRAALDRFLAADPYRINGVADFQPIEFVPGRHQPILGEWLGTKPQA